MEKVGHPSSLLFKKARQWYETASLQKQFQSALAEAQTYSKGISSKEKQKLHRAFNSANKNYDLSAAKLQAELKTSVRAHFAAMGIVEGTIIRLTYPVYRAVAENDSEQHVERMAAATIQVKGFAFTPKDATNTEERFRVVANVVNSQGEIEQTSRYFPFDKRCAFETIS